jgi:GSPII_E N-terminal domain.
MCKECSLPETQPALAMATPFSSHITLSHAHDLAACIAALLKNNSQQVTQFALVTLILHFTLYDEQQHSHHIEHSMHYYSKHLRPFIRRTDALIRTQRTLYFVLIGADRQGGIIAQERLWEALLWQAHSVQESEIFSPDGMSIGVSASAPRALSEGNTLYSVIRASARPQHSFEQTIYDEDDADQRTEPTTEPLPTLAATQGSSATLARDNGQNLYALARHLGIPYLAFLPRNVPKKLHQICSPQLAHELHCYPIGRERNTLTVAFSDPGDQRILARLRQETGLQIFPVLAPAHELQMALEQM